MKTLLRLIVVGLFLLFAWPFFLYKKYGNTKIELPKKTIIIGNHYSTFDPFFIYLMFFKKKIYFIATIDVKKRLLPRLVCWLFDCIYVDSLTSPTKYIRDSLKKLNEDAILCIYPEGYVNPRKFGFLEFYKSYIFLAKKTKANILPIYIYPELKVFKKSQIYIGDIATFDDYTKYSDNEEINMYFMSSIMNYSSEIEKIKEKASS